MSVWVVQVSITNCFRWNFKWLLNTCEIMLIAIDETSDNETAVELEDLSTQKWWIGRNLY